MTKEQLTRVRKECGDEYLYRQLAEECMELGHAALKLIRVQRGETSVSLGEAKTTLIDEAANVCVMLNALDDMLDADEHARLVKQATTENQRMVARLLGE